MGREEFRIANRHLSESQWRDAWADRTGQNSHDVDRDLWRDRDRRNEYYDRLDAGEDG